MNTKTELSEKELALCKESFCKAIKLSPDTFDKFNLNFFPNDFSHGWLACLAADRGQEAYMQERIDIIGRAMVEGGAIKTTFIPKEEMEIPATDTSQQAAEVTPKLTKPEAMAAIRTLYKYLEDQQLEIKVLLARQEQQAQEVAELKVAVERLIAVATMPDETGNICTSDVEAAAYIVRGLLTKHEGAKHGDK